MKRIAILGISGKLGRYMTQHALDRGYEVTGVCRPESVGKLDDLIARNPGRITVYPGRTDDPAAVAQAVAGAVGVLTVLAPWGRTNYASGTARAVIDHAEPGARLVFSCGWHITRDGRDVYSWKIRAIVALVGPIARWTGFADLDDQVRATDLIFASETAWTVVRGSSLEEGPSQGLPVWARHVGDPILASDLTRRTDFALFMVAAVEDDSLIQEAPAIVGRETPSARAHAPSLPAAAT
jgi:NAD(P)-dependent dehydrogenase (short-subunit alcohol dehydrogenase family)